MTDERKALYWLSVGGVPTEKQNELLRIYGCALDIFDAFPSEKLREYVGDGVYASLRKQHDEELLDGQLRKLHADGIRVLLRGFPDYPALLAQTETDPPAVLYAKGNTDLLKRRMICMVGTRRCTDYGKRVATEWAAELSSKFVLVTGHATGIDTYALKGCLGAGGKAVVVLACGMDKFVLPDFARKCPPENLLLLSEYPPVGHAMKFTFLGRNRLLSGLAEGTVVVEASKKSGALITADWACKQNRTVFAVPGSVFSDRSAGVHALLRHGAVAATSVADIFEDLSVDYGEAAEEELPEMNEEERKVYDFLSDGARPFDRIADMLSIPPHEASALLSLMELKGIVEKKMQNYYARLR